MRQAIEEDFILDVLASYTTYRSYFKLLKTIEADPKYEQRKAQRVLLRFVDLHDHSIRQKIEIMVEHFADHVRSRIKGKAKAMVVTRSRLHAVRYFLALRDYLEEQKAGYKALVAFSGAVQNEGVDYTEAGLNGLPETQTANAFNTDTCRFLVVAEKFQTGFDQPLLHTMYVDKKLSGVHAVQTLSRLNRTHPHKAETMVLDFANDADAILDSFKPYYEASILSEATDPNQLYDLQNQLADFDLFMQSEVDAFAAEWFHAKGSQDKLHGILAPVVERFRDQDAEDQAGFRSVLRDYTRLYSFLSQVLTFADLELEKLYVFARMLFLKLPVDPAELPREVLDNVDMDSYRLRLTHNGEVTLEPDTEELYPIVGPGIRVAKPEDLYEVLSRIIELINMKFGVALTEADRICVETALRSLEQDPALDASCRANTRENASLTFRQKFEEAVQGFVDSNFKLYKRITDDERFGSTLRDALFDFYLRRHREVRDLVTQGESKTLEFKSTLRWNLEEDRKDNRITHAVLKTIGAFLNTEGGDLLIGVADDGAIIGIEADRFDSNDRYLLHLAQVTRNGLGDRAGTCIDPRIQTVDGKNVCLVACSRSPESVYLKWKGTEKSEAGDLFVRSGPGTVLLEAESAEEYVRTRFDTRPLDDDSS
jgi:type I restriction enzyme R subunit